MAIDCLTSPPWLGGDPWTRVGVAVRVSPVEKIKDVPGRRPRRCSSPWWRGLSWVAPVAAAPAGLAAAPVDAGF